MLITCGNCRKKLGVDDGLADQFGQCPVCGVALKMPSLEQASNVPEGEPPPTARVIPEDELKSMGFTLEKSPEEQAASYTEAGEASQTKPPPDGVETDEEGYVLAIPVEEERPGEPAASGQGEGPSDEDREYALADEPTGPPDDAGFSKSLDQMLGRLDSDDASRGAKTGKSSDAAQPVDKIILRCPGCKGLLAIEAQFAGQMRTCPKCATEIDVPHESTVVLPDGAARTSGGVSAHWEPPPSALAEDLSDDVDLESYIAEPVTESVGVASYWVILAFVVGATVGFTVGWLLAGYYSRPGPPDIEPAPAQVEDLGTKTETTP